MIRFPQWLSCKESTCNVGDTCSIPRLGRSSKGGYGNPFQYSCCGNNPMHREALQAKVHRVEKSDTTDKKNILRSSQFVPPVWFALFPLHDVI